MSSKDRVTRPVRILFEYSGLLLIGTCAALVWANLDPDVRDEDGHVVHHGSYSRFIHYPLIGADAHHDHSSTERGHSERDKTEQHDSAADEASQPAHDGGREAADGGESTLPTGEDESSIGESDAGAHEPDESASARTLTERVYSRLVLRPIGGVNHGITVHFIINDFLMAFFFAIASKEVLESFLPGGALSNFRKAATPIMATIGGILGPAGVYIGGAVLVNQSGWFGQPGELGRGWAIPCATDIAFSYLFARLIFGSGHPAIAFLLLLAIADDAAGLIILAIAYPTREIEAEWLLLTLMAIGIAIGFQRMRLQNFWWYLLIPGLLCWLSFDLAGIHPALGLAPIVFLGMPHAHSDLGIFAREELKRHDTLNEFEHWWKNPVEIILGLFGLANAGVVINSVGHGTWLVLVGLLIGKPLGITLFTWIAERLLQLEVPAGMTYRHIVSLGMVAAIGFTVALFVSTAAFKTPGPIQDSVKMGALLSFSAALIAYALARVLGIRPVKHAA